MSDSADKYAPRRYEVRHRTTYTYDDDVSSCFERGFLRLRSTPSQTIVASELTVTPTPDVITEHVDYFGNASHYIEIRTAHRQLVVLKRSIVDVAWPEPDVAALNRWTVAEAAAAASEAADPVEAVDHLLPSALVELGPQVERYARRTLVPDRPLGDALVALTRGIYADFRYKSGVTSVRTTIAELLELRQGVCQDFAHLAIGCLRSAGIPGRYVSGYLETTPPPGKPKLEGSDATHAWVSALTPLGWIDLDPTNDHLVDSRYVVTAWGRDFRDVSPLKGVIFTDSKKSKLDVGVDVIRLPDDHDQLRP